MDYSLPGSSIQGILQARILEWVAIPFSRGSSWLRDQTQVSLCLLHWQVGSLLLSLPGKPPLITQFSSVTQSEVCNPQIVCLTVCNPQIACNTPGFPVQSSHPLASPSPPTFNLSSIRVFSQWVSSSHQVAKVLELQLQHQSFQWIFRTNFL